MTKMKRSSKLLSRVVALMRDGQWLKATLLFERNRAAVRRNWKLSWNLGWCYFKLENWAIALEHLAQADRLAPNNFACKYGLGSVYLKKRQFKKAERALVQATRIKESKRALASLALAYLSQGKIGKAEKAHLRTIRLHPAHSQPYRAYAAFLYDVGRRRESAKMTRKARRREIAEANNGSRSDSATRHT
jgi:tetratricopeptide (TPR) repeat protein